jgi:predicted transcriptional regulator
LLEKEESQGMKVKDVMTTNVITVKEDQTRQQAARLLAQHRISGLPVVNDGGILVGVVSEYDIIGKEGKTIGDIMSRGVISVGADTDLEEASHILVHERIRRLPVVDQGKVIGIISRSDVVKEMATRWVCYVCGEIIHSDEQPERCPRCGATGVVSANEPVAPGS